MLLRRIHISLSYDVLLRDIRAVKEPNSNQYWFEGIVGLTYIRRARVNGLTVGGGIGMSDNALVKLMSPIDVVVSDVLAEDSDESVIRADGQTIYPFFIDCETAVRSAFGTLVP